MTDLAILEKRGWFMTENGLKKLTHGAVLSEAEIIKLALDTDIKDFGKAHIPDGWSKKDNVAIGGVLQIQKIRNVAAPKANQESQGAPRMLRISLSDGHNTMTALETEPWRAVSLCTPPGTKVRLRRPVPVRAGFLLPPNDALDALGGHVTAMVDKWLMNKAFASQDSRPTGADGARAPKWVPFGKNIAEEFKADENFKSLANCDGEVVDEEFEAQRRAQIAELGRAKRKQFGGGTKQMTDGNLQTLLSAGFSQDESEAALKYTCNDVGRAMQNLQRYRARQQDRQVAPDGGRGGDRGGGRGRGRRDDRSDGGGRRRHRDEEDEEATSRPSQPVTLLDFVGLKIGTDGDRPESTSGCSGGGDRGDSGPGYGGGMNGDRADGCGYGGDRGGHGGDRDGRGGYSGDRGGRGGYGCDRGGRGGYGGDRVGHGGDRYGRGGYSGDRGDRGGYGGDRGGRGGYGGDRGGHGSGRGGDRDGRGVYGGDRGSRGGYGSDRGSRGGYRGGQGGGRFGYGDDKGVYDDDRGDYGGGRGGQRGGRGGQRGGRGGYGSRGCRNDQGSGGSGQTDQTCHTTGDGFVEGRRARQRREREGDQHEREGDQHWGGAPADDQQWPELPGSEPTPARRDLGQGQLGSEQGAPYSPGDAGRHKYTEEEMCLAKHPRTGQMSLTRVVSCELNNCVVNFVDYGECYEEVSTDDMEPLGYESETAPSCSAGAAGPGQAEPTAVFQHRPGAGRSGAAADDRQPGGGGADRRGGRDTAHRPDRSDDGRDGGGNGNGRVDYQRGSGGGRRGYQDDEDEWRPDRGDRRSFRGERRGHRGGGRDYRGGAKNYHDSDDRYGDADLHGGRRDHQGAGRDYPGGAKDYDNDHHYEDADLRGSLRGRNGYNAGSQTNSGGYPAGSGGVPDGGRRQGRGRSAGGYEDRGYGAGEGDQTGSTDQHSDEAVPFRGTMTFVRGGKRPFSQRGVRGGRGGHRGS